MVSYLTRDSEWCHRAGIPRNYTGRIFFPASLANIHSFREGWNWVVPTKGLKPHVYCGDTPASPLTVWCKDAEWTHKRLRGLWEKPADCRPTESLWVVRTNVACRQQAQCGRVGFARPSCRLRPQGKPCGGVVQSCRLKALLVYVGCAEQAFRLREVRGHVDSEEQSCRLRGKPA